MGGRREKRRTIRFQTWIEVVACIVSRLATTNLDRMKVIGVVQQLEKMEKRITSNSLLLGKYYHNNSI
jgi:saccharopine dehydrogenase-like NADP-dependent oxidoreductase